MKNINGITLHWTAGQGRPTINEKKHYHYLISADAKIFPGKFKPEDNMHCLTGQYAAHTGGGNSGRIGVAFCGMKDFKNLKEPGLFPLNEAQLEKGFLLCAKLMGQYNIPLENIETHYTFGKAHPKTTSFGKIDIMYLPCYPKLKPNDVLKFMRSKINWYYKNYVL
jgi:N-acetyl-anhydromuramyl-L-alanine amidase AmpD